MHTTTSSPPRRGQSSYSVAVRCPEGRVVVRVRGFVAQADAVQQHAEDVARALDAGNYVGAFVVNLNRRAR